MSYLWLRCSKARRRLVKEPFPRWQTHQRRLLHNDHRPCYCQFQWQGQGGGHHRRLRHCQLCHQHWRSHWCRPSGHPFLSMWRECGSSKVLTEKIELQNKLNGKAAQKWLIRATKRMIKLLKTEQDAEIPVSVWLFFENLFVTTCYIYWEWHGGTFM